METTWIFKHNVGIYTLPFKKLRNWGVVVKNFEIVMFEFYLGMQSICVVQAGIYPTFWYCNIILSSTKFTLKKLKNKLQKKIHNVLIK